jgi:serine/threonine protein phosphatase PrpC
VDTLGALLTDPRGRVLRPDLLEFRLQEANDRVAEQVGGQTTATGLWLWEETEPKPCLVAGWAHVGDSRLYRRSRTAGWSAITRDHSRGSGLGRAIGDGPGLVVDAGRLQLEPLDWLILATDGVWKRACPAKLRLEDHYRTPEELTGLLARTARENGSRDDATVIVLRIAERSDHRASRAIRDRESSGP